MTPTDDPSDPDGAGNDDQPGLGEDLIALRDGDLDDEQERRVRERIERDPQGVAELLDQLDQTDAILERIRSHPPPPELTERLEAAIADEVAARDAGENRPVHPDDDERADRGRDGDDPGQ